MSLKSDPFFYINVEYGSGSTPPGSATQKAKTIFFCHINHKTLLGVLVSVLSNYSTYSEDSLGFEDALEESAEITKK